MKKQRLIVAIAINFILISLVATILVLGAVHIHSGAIREFLEKGPFPLSNRLLWCAWTYVLGWALVSFPACFWILTEKKEYFYCHPRGNRCSVYFNEMADAFLLWWYLLLVCEETKWLFRTIGRKLCLVKH